MGDIGKARRKPSRNPQFDTILQMPVNPRHQRTISDVTIEPNEYDELPSLARNWAAKSLVPPFWGQDPLAFLKNLPRMDSFSAYVITLMLAEGKTLAGTNHSIDSVGNFWFPFVQESALLCQFRELLTSPDILRAIYLGSLSKLEPIALEYYLSTISCVESRLASPNSDIAASNAVMNAVMALICYNFVNHDFDQALVHVKGLGLVIAARGGISRLQDNDELRLMIFWVDVTASLLYELKPQFPFPSDLVPTIMPSPYPAMMPTPLINVWDAEPTSESPTRRMLSCIAELNAVAALIDSELAAKGDDMWKDERFMGLRLNPITHRLLDLPRQDRPMAQPDLLLEALRLGAILWIIWIKRRYRAYPGTCTTYVSRLLDLLSIQQYRNQVSSALDDVSVQLWLLVLCVISSESAGARTTAMHAIAWKMRQLGWRTWVDVMIHVRQMPWTDAFEALCAELGREVEDRVK
ncbi:hypothetical protein N0V90_003738 [Kalmusia sp. IMI 367209]|nr:hypothetical protein N0V90_003738 [Kalmusia sp. IMI 367209]